MAIAISDPLVLTVKKTLTELKVLPSSKILIGVSGGVDSMVLINVLKMLNYKIAAAHVNFQLRGIESDEDALLVRNWCADNNVPYLNVQLAAREIRYKWWSELMANESFQYLATAHQKDDNIETILLNLLRGTGIKGLAGIPLKRDFYIRPLLRVSREEIESFARSHNISFRTDSSNQSDQYQRNRLRHHLIPGLRELVADDGSWMDQTLHRIRFEWDAWENAYLHWQQTNVTADDQKFAIAAEENEYPYLLRWLEEKGVPWQLSHDFILPQQSGKGKVLEYEGYQLSRTKSGFYFEPVRNFETIVIEKTGSYKVGEDEFLIEEVNLGEFEKDRDPNIEFINKEIVKWPLHIRSILPGDRFHPLGMNGQTKKIQVFLVDLKLDHFEKSNIRILVSGAEIIWVIGRRIDENAKVKADSKNVYRLEYRSNQHSVTIK
jgi:tRNA(Ile)-lysidine synthase